jgi:hypothetical protein
MTQLKVKPTTAPILPATFTFTGADGNIQTARINKGTTGKEFDPRVNEHGDQWVMVNGTVVIGGISPGGFVVAGRTDTFGNPGLALPSATYGTAPLNSTSAAYEASRLVKASSGTLLGLSGYNSKASTQFILVCDYGAPSVPPTGTIPAVIIAVAASSNFSYDPGNYGRAFSAGIWVVNSSTGPTVTVGSADTWFDVQYV